MPAGLQDAFLAECKQQGTPVVVHLMSGLELRGTVKGFDPFTLLLEYERRTHLIYKHAITMISPGAQAGTLSNDAATVAPLASEPGDS